ncbi:phosphoserine phosphatase SerB [Sphingomonas sp. LaA6.9]|uniref:phosphoserine phosphatase SerB n=1 Tax=Sphingomonas sp. LaA6.9 TaxID=2919914 RepID=UPI001F4F55DF|nr:phosphoserine phosphatase SerB [Sphingomonas sp. LaA6.9]MCJ8157554.1 phosphoserine phosphatase SerB [Sphingomonas sp. LaA6.9]
MFIATLIAEGLRQSDMDRAARMLADAGQEILGAVWIDEGTALDLRFTGDLETARTALKPLQGDMDVIVQPEAGREKKLLISDMDSTMITIECIDELADYAGLRAEISDVTERAMRGELDFEGALDARVALLKGLPAATLETCYRERVVLMPGARTLVGTMRARGARTVLVSGGFTNFADPVAADIGFDRAVSNTLGFQGDALDGTVARPIVGAEAKRATLIEEVERLGLSVAETLAVGDGANDIPMIEAAGLGVAYHAKEKAAAAADARIVHGDLTTLLYAQGIAREAWIED